MLKSNINTCFRILSVLLTVVIVSVCFLQPIAYANAAVVAGGALVLLVAALLVSVGLTFESSQQLEAAANYAVSALPNDLRQDLDNVIEVNFPDNWGGGGGSDPQEPKPPFNTSAIAILLKIMGVVYIGVELYNRFKAWANETFGIDKAVEDGSDTASLVFSNSINIVDSTGNTVTLPVYPYAHKDITDSGLNNWFDFKVNGHVVTATFTDVITGNSSYYDSIGFSIYIDGKFSDGATCHNDYGLKFKLCTDGSNLYIIRYHMNYSKTGSNAGKIHNSAINIDLSKIVNPIGEVGIDKPAYNYSPGMVYQDGVPIAITPEISGLIEKNYQDVINDYSLDNWDYNKTIEEMKQQLAELAATIDGVADYEALQQKTDALQKELDRLRELVGAQTVDAVGGVNELNNALIDSAIVIDGLRDLIKAQEHEAARIAELEKELTAAKEKIQELTDSATGSIEVPIDPPVTGEIDFSPLLVFADFSKVFPFCIPFDITAMFKSLKTTPVAPKFEIPFEIPGVFKEKITFDLSYIESVMPMVRAFVLLGFAVVLAFVTSTVIKW